MQPLIACTKTSCWDAYMYSGAVPVLHVCSVQNIAHQLTWYGCCVLR